MLHVLKIEHWEKVRPFEFYMTPLKQAITKVRSSLLEMNRLGHLRIKYVIEKNEELAKEIDVMVQKDMVAQLLVGNELKQDQFRFMYDTVKIIYDSALQTKLVNLHDKKNEAIESTVIPELIAFKSLLRIRDIQLRKYREAKEAK
jgi:hypothetical protein